MSPAARMLAFVLLLVAMFAVAYAVGARLGPVRLTHQQQQQQQQQHGTQMNMPMGAGSAALTTAPWPDSGRG